jgi:hypothetical protein
MLEDAGIPEIPERSTSEILWPEFDLRGCLFFLAFAVVG